MNYEQAKANYERTKADYEAAVNAWEDSRLYAPFDGYVQQAHIERYQDVKPSVPVVTFIDLSRIKVEATCPRIWRCRCGKKILWRVWSASMHFLTGNLCLLNIS